MSLQLDYADDAQYVSDSELAAARDDAVRRERARRSLHDFTTYTYPEYIVSPFSQFVAALIDCWISASWRPLEKLGYNVHELNSSPFFKLGDPRFIMCFAPPQHGKSELAVVRAPAFIAGKLPGSKVMGVSYADELIRFHTRHARSVVRSEEYAELWPHAALSKERWASNEWELNHYEVDAYDEVIMRNDGMPVIAATSSYKCAGIDGSITGRGYTHGLLDDLISGHKDAESPAVREKTWQAIWSDFWTRRANGAPVWYSTTRWHKDDPAGRFQLNEAQGGTLQWTVVNFPALAKDGDVLSREVGEPLVPELHDEDDLTLTIENAPSYTVAALYDGMPVAKGDRLLKREWFDVVDRVPEDLEWTRFWDLGFTERKEDKEREKGSTAGISLGGPDDEGTYYLRNGVVGAWRWPRTRKVILTSCRIEGDDVEYVIEEAGQQGGYIDELVEAEEFAPYAIVGRRPVGNKRVRALAWSAKAERGKMKLLRGRWNNHFLESADDFTGMGDPNDHIIDAVSGAWDAHVGDTASADVV